MTRSLAVLAAALALVACGPKIKPNLDAGDDDAGFDAGVIDAGRVRGDDPPTGYSIALDLHDGGTQTRVGVSAALALDQFKQPLIAGLDIDPNGDDVRQDDRLFFIRWDGTAKKFTEAKVVEVIGQVNVVAPHRQVSIARQAETGRISIAYVNSQNQVRLAYSDDEGTNFSQETVSVPLNDASVFSDPVIAYGAGNALHVAYLARPAGCAKGTCGKAIYRTRVGSGAFADSEAPRVSGTGLAVDSPLAMVLDGAGVATLAFFEDTTVDDTMTLASWTAGSSTGSPIADSGNTANDTVARRPSVSLTLSGSDVLAAFHLARAAADTQLWFSRRSGTTWNAPVAVPRNGLAPNLEGTGWYQAIVGEGGSKVAIGAMFRQPSPLGPGQCGGPKLGRSSDGATFTVCQLPEKPVTQKSFGVAGEFLNLAPHADGKLTGVFIYDNKNNPSLMNRAGVILYREP